MENLLSSNSLILLFWIIISFIVDSGKKPYVVVIMTYIMIFIANFFDVVATFPSIFITILALYIYFVTKKGNVSHYSPFLFFLLLACSI